MEDENVFFTMVQKWLSYRQHSLLEACRNITCKYKNVGDFYAKKTDFYILSFVLALIVLLKTSSQELIQLSLQSWFYVEKYDVKFIYKKRVSC